MDLELLQWGEFFALQEIADGFPGGVIENQSKGALVGLVLGEKDHRAMEDALAQRRIREQQLSLELDRKFGMGWVSGHARTLLPANRFANRGLWKIFNHLGKSLEVRR
jgi:hypothetical protein